MRSFQKIIKRSGVRAVFTRGFSPHMIMSFASPLGVGLESLGVETGRGIVVDGHMQTSVPGVYAAGDVTAFSMLAHTASREAEVAVNHMLGIPDEMAYDAIPGIENAEKDLDYHPEPAL